MDILVFISAIVVFILHVIALLLGPFIIGKPRPVYTGSQYVISIFTFVLIIFVCGRIFGWF